MEIKKRIRRIRKKCIILCAKILTIGKKPSNNKIIIDNFLGKGYGDNPKYICNELLKQELGLDIVWLVKDVNCILPPGVRPVKYGTLHSIMEYLTAKIWIDNVRNSFKPNKKENQFYIQTWHGNLGNKKVEGAAEKELPKDYVIDAQRDASMTNLMISGSSFFTNLIRDYFWYDGEVMECGTPRLDVFFHEHSALITKVKKHFDAFEAKIILYAPTFRDNNDVSCYEMNYERIIDTFEALYDEPCIMLIRMHPNVSGLSNKLNYSDRIKNASDYPDLYELIIASEAIITDYSSISFEAGILLKPVFLYAVDLHSYIAQRGFLIDPYEQPYPLAVNEEELVYSIIHFNKEQYNKRLADFNRNLGIIENGCAASILANRILDEINNKEE